MKNSKETDKIMASLDHVTPVKAPPDFYANVQQRLQKKKGRVINIRKSPRWQMAAAAMGLLVATNLAIVFSYNPVPAENGDFSEIIANEYNLYPETSYELLAEQ